VEEEIIAIVITEVVEIMVEGTAVRDLDRTEDATEALRTTETGGQNEGALQDQDQDQDQGLTEDQKIGSIDDITQPGLSSLSKSY